MATVFGPLVAPKLVIVIVVRRPVAFHFAERVADLGLVKLLGGALARVRAHPVADSGRPHAVEGKVFEVRCSRPVRVLSSSRPLLDEQKIIIRAITGGAAAGTATATVGGQISSGAIENGRQRMGDLHAAAEDHKRANHSRRSMAMWRLSALVVILCLLHSVVAVFKKGDTVQMSKRILYNKALFIDGVEHIKSFNAPTCV